MEPQNIKPTSESIGDKEGFSNSEIERMGGKMESPTVESLDVDPKRWSRIKRKIHWRLLPILTVTYSISLIDRQNVSSAYVSGMGTELDLMVGTRYSVAILVFFAPYILFELPSNMALRKVGAANWLSLIAFSWGAVTLGIGFSKNWTTLVACRVVMGMFEAGFFPGCVYVISCWYTRYESGKPLSAFYYGAQTLSGFSGIIAAGLKEINVGQYHGWRWIFIIEGLVTIVLAVLAFFFIIDFPYKAHFLSEEDRELVLRKIDADRQDAHEDKMTLMGILRDLTDWKIWSFGFNFMALSMVVNVYVYFGQAILLAMGFSLNVALIMVLPTTIVAVVSGFTMMIYSDKYALRAPFIIVNFLFCILGACLVGFCDNKGGKVFGLFAIVLGSQANYPFVIAHQTNNVRGVTKRGVAAAIQIGGGGIGGTFASLVFRSQDAPRYIPGLIAAITCSVAVILNCIVTSYVFWRLNKKQAAGTLKKPLEGLEGFRYTY